VDRMSKILLAIDQPEVGHAELRAILLVQQLGVNAIDVIATRRAGGGIGTRTASSRLRIDGGALSALIDGEQHCLEEVAAFGRPPHAWTMRDANAAGVVAAAAEEIGADLVVLQGAAGSALASWIWWPKNAAVAGLCRSPVLLVNAEPRDMYRKILVALDYSKASLAAARAALRMAPSASFVFLHAWRLQDEGLMRELALPERVIAGYREQGWESARTRLNDYVELFFPDVQSCSRVVHHGTPHGGIVHHARRWGADLVVIGKERIRPGRRFMPGSLTQRLATRGACDLLVGPAPHGRDDDQRLAA